VFSDCFSIRGHCYILLKGYCKKKYFFTSIFAISGMCCLILHIVVDISSSVNAFKWTLSHVHLFKCCTLTLFFYLYMESREYSLISVCLLNVSENNVTLL